MGKISHIYVPAELNMPAKIMIIGEAPGKDEEDNMEGGLHRPRPFIGRSGQLLTRYLGRHRIRRKEVAFSNLCKYRPSGNKFEVLLGSKELTLGIEELKEEIKAVNPNIIIACGNWPMFMLTGKTGEKGKPGTGITLWRGSVVPCTLVEGYKVLITYHPAYIVRPQGFDLNPIFHFDIGKAIKECNTKELVYPEYTDFINPPYAVLEELAHQIVTAPQVATDIETFGNSLACVGFSCDPKWGLCITHDYKYGWDIPREILAHDVPKIFQFGVFDINYLDRFYNWIVRGYKFDFSWEDENEGIFGLSPMGQLVGWDTYVAAATLMPEFPRGLDFLTSVYTPFPYYKQDGKTWKESKDPLQFWKYNIKDCIATLLIAIEQQREVAELFDECKLRKEARKEEARILAARLS